MVEHTRRGVEPEEGATFGRRSVWNGRRAVSTWETRGRRPVICGLPEVDLTDDGPIESQAPDSPSDNAGDDGRGRK